MSCGCNHSPCTCTTCDPEHEPLSSALNNFITEFFGTLTKTCVNGVVTWQFPCDLTTGITGYPRIAGEGLACYFMRVLQALSDQIVPSSLLVDLISHWRLDETSGMRFDAHNAFNNNLTDINTVGAAAAKINNGADFDEATDEELIHSSNSSLQMGDISFTVAAWVRIEAKVGHDLGIIGKRDLEAIAGNEAFGEYDLRLDNQFDRFQWQLNAGSGPSLLYANTLGSPAIATWYYVIAQYDAPNTDMGIMVNNGHLDILHHVGGAQITTDTFRLGNVDGTGTHHFNGLIDSVSVWKRLLTAAEKTQLYNNGNGLDYPF